MRVPRWALYVVGVLPLVALFGLLLWALLDDDAGSPGGLAVFDSSGEANVLRETPSDFTLLQFDGTTATLSEFLGRPIMVDFWGSWCVPCRREAATLEKVWREYADRGVVFIGVDVFDTDSRARSFIREFDITYPVGPDPKGRIAVEYGLTGVPEKYFIDRQGRIVRKLVGPLSEDRLTEILDQLLAPAPS